jgi:hypothetical protein
MKKLLFALLICGTAILAAGQTPKVEADCVYLRYYYYTAPGGTECGLMYVYCDAEPVRSGCQTPYYHLYGGCACP